MSVSQRSTIERDEQVAISVAAVVATGISAVLLATVGPPESLLAFAWLVGGSTQATGLAVWIVLGLAFGVYYAGAMARNVNPFSNTIIMVSRNSRVVQALLVPILHRSALGLTAGSMGFIYGQILGFGFFAWLVPLLLVLNGRLVSIPLADFAVIGAYMLYGIVLGTVYGVLLEAHWFEPAATEAEQNAAVGGAVAGGLFGLGVLALLGGADTLTALGSVVGGTGPLHGALVFLALAIVLGLAFAWVLARSIDRFTASIISVTQRSDLIRRLLVPLLERSALTATAGSMGLVFGLAVGLIAVLLGALPALPQLGAVGVVAFGAYGLGLGNGYGMLLESADSATVVPGATYRAGAMAAIVGGLVSSLLVVALVQFPLFSWLASGVGADGIVPGLAVWLVLCVALGLAFVWVVRRTINEFTAAVIGFSQRSRLTRNVLVPLVERAALTVTAGAIGIGYGLALGVFAYILSVAGPFPALGLPVVLVFTVFGAVLGNGYGAVLEEPTLPTPSLPAPADPEEPAADPTAADPEDLTRFAAWRAQRPFSGGLLLILAGLMIGALPVRLQIIFPGMSWSALGLGFAVLIVASGLVVLARPDLSTPVGMAAVALSILSLIGSFGGLVIGMLVGIVGGNLCISWQPPAERDQPPAGETGEAAGERFDWMGEASK